MLQQFILVIHFIAAFAIIGLVLLQHGKGAEVGASFGSGASQTLFGSQGSTSFLTKLTAIFALVFALTSLSLSYLNSHKKESSVIEQIQIQQARELPTAPGDASDSTDNVEADKAKTDKPAVEIKTEKSNAN